jgi:hypothetical protein
MRTRSTAVPSTVAGSRAATLTAASARLFRIQRRLRPIDACTAGSAAGGTGRDAPSGASPHAPAGVSTVVIVIGPAASGIVRSVRAPSGKRHMLRVTIVASPAGRFWTVEVVST